MIWLAPSGINSTTETLDKRLRKITDLFPWCLISLVLLLGITSCCTPSPAPPVDISQPGWFVRQGQAIWMPRRGAEGIGGELLVATHTNGSCFVQFYKPPFNLVTGWRSTTGWNIEFQQGHKQYGNNGTPPSRWIWFELARVVTGNNPDAGWKYALGADGHWTLFDLQNGELLEGFLTP